MKKLYTGLPKFTFFPLLITLLVLVSYVMVPVQALPTLAQFDADPGLVLSDQDFYSLPLNFSSKEKIQQFLVGQGSFLANMTFPVSLVPDSAVLNVGAFAPRPIQYRTPTQIGPYLGTTMSAADIIWNLTRSNMSSSCSMYYSGGKWYTNDICYDAAANPINPGFMLSMIQKESGLIYGVNAKLNPNDANTQFLLDRVVGYYCFETPDRSQSCYDENPDWIYYKGFFRQLFFAVRLLRLREQMCRVGGSYAFSNSSGVYAVGKFVTVSGRSIQLKNGISCSMYIYTPHISSQRLALSVMQQLQIDRNLLEVKGLPPEYIPAKMTHFSDQLEQINTSGQEAGALPDPKTLIKQNISSIDNSAQ